MRDRPQLTVRSASAILLAATGATLMRPAMADIDLSSSVTVGSQYDTNARQLASIELAPTDDKGKRSRDAASMYVSANVAAKLGGTGPLQMQAQASYNHSDSFQQNSLSHDDYSVGVNASWKPSQVYDLAFQASQARAPIGLADIGGFSTVQQRATNVLWTARVRPTPRWQLTVSPGWNETLTPLTKANDFQLLTKTATASIEFLGAGQLVPGIGGNVSKSTYAGITNPTSYKQRSAFGMLNYKVTALTTFGLSAGKTWRETTLRDPSSSPTTAPLAGSDSAFTGSLGINRQLTPKTGVNVSIYRNFQQYDAGVNTSIGTGFTVGVNWAATPRFTASLTTAFAQSDIDNVVFRGTTITRTDLLRSYSLGMNYRASRTVSVATTVSRYIRRSEVWVDQYNGTVGSLTVAIRFD